MEKTEKYSTSSKLLPGFFNITVKLFCLFFVYYLFLSTDILAQNAEIKLDTNSILLGDQIKLKLKINVQKNAKVTFPQLTDTITQNIEIVNTGKIDTLNDAQNNTITYSQDITITSFDSGYFAIPPFKFSYLLDKDTTTYYAETEVQLLEVKKIATSEQADIKDIKDIFEAPLTLREMLPYIIGIIVLVILIVLGFIFWKKIKKNGSLSLIKKPEIPPHIEALQAFEKLKKRKLWQNNFVKEFYSELTDILRKYIERALSVNSLELTTEETMEAIKKTTLDTNSSMILKQVLELSDLVKFAKYTPLPSDHESCFNKSVDFVKNTMPTTTVIQKDNNQDVDDDSISENKTEL